MLHLATPVILTHPKSVVSKHLTKVFLNCSAHDYGVDSIQYKWEKYQPSDDKWKKVPRSHKINTSPNLILDVVAEKDEGVYRCVATNDDGITVSNNATITVYGEFHSSVA